MEESKSLATMVAQEVENMKKDGMGMRSNGKVNLAELSRRTGISRQRLRTLEKGGFEKEAIDEERLLAGFNMLVTSVTRLSGRAVYNTYHNLWRIEQSIRMMKSYLDARPAFASAINSIKGHFLICYIGIVLERLLEFHVLGNRFGYEKIIDFVRAFTLVRLDSRNYQNMLTSNDEVGQFLEQTLCPQITNFFISPADISMFMKFKLNKRLDDYRVI